MVKARLPEVQSRSGYMPPPYQGKDPDKLIQYGRHVSPQGASGAADPHDGVPGENPGSRDEWTT
jgi:hypothetical protein